MSTNTIHAVLCISSPSPATTTGSLLGGGWMLFFNAETLQVLVLPPSWISLLSGIGSERGFRPRNPRWRQR